MPSLTSTVTHALALASALLLAPACRSAAPPTLGELAQESDVEAAGARLVKLPNGLNRLDQGDGPPRHAVIAVHGYRTRGKEWVEPLLRLGEREVAVYFYRWDTRHCPDRAVPRLHDALARLLAEMPTIERVTIVGHSYGGLVTTLTMQGLAPRVPAELHIVAAPLASMPPLVKLCGFTGVRELPPAGAQTRWHQWRTVHAQDGAFKSLEVDPQVVTLPGSGVTQLPATLESGERLGHSRSLTWVVDRLPPIDGGAPTPEP